jgi:hypothetical protein
LVEQGLAATRDARLQHEASSDERQPDDAGKDEFASTDHP